MFAYDDLVQWCKDRCSDQANRRNRAWDFGREHGLNPCEVAWNNVAVRWIDGVVYVVSRNGAVWLSCVALRASVVRGFDYARYVVVA